MKAMSPGKLVRYTVADGGDVKADQPYAEVEVMKMFMPLLAPAAGAFQSQMRSPLFTIDCSLDEAFSVSLID